MALDVEDAMGAGERSLWEQNELSNSLTGRGDQLLNQSLFFGIDHARGAIAEWKEGFNTARCHSSLGHQTPADFAGALTATASDASLDKGFASPPVAQPEPYGVAETAEAPIVAG